MEEMLSTNFSLAEMIASETAARKGIDNKPSVEEIANLRQLCLTLEHIRDILGSRPLRITSGYRSDALNETIGGSPLSAHRHGLAADFICPPHTPLEVARLIDASGIGFDQLIFEYDWVHIAIPAEGTSGRRQVLTKAARGGYLTGLQA